MIPLDIQDKYKGTTELEWLEYLGEVSGSLDEWLKRYSKKNLFDMQLKLESADDLREVWNKALKVGTRMRIKMLQSNALAILEEFGEDDKVTASAKVSYAKLLLDEHLVGPIEIAKSRVKRAFAITGDQDEDIPEPDSDELDEIERELTA